jgi:hypothetical protein
MQIKKQMLQQIPQVTEVEWVEGYSWVFLASKTKCWHMVLLGHEYLCSKI